MYYNKPIYGFSITNPMFNYEEVQRLHYEQIQNKKATDAIKAVHDFRDAIDGLDEYHRNMVFSSCIAEMAVSKTRTKY